MSLELLPADVSARQAALGGRGPPRFNTPEETAAGKGPFG